MYSVYAIKSLKDGRIYIGLSSNIKKRILDHNSGYVFSTKGYRPWKLIFQEAIGLRKEARKKEKYLKSGVGRELIKSIPL